MKHKILLIVFSFCSFLTQGQKHDFVWTFGYDGHHDHPEFEATNLDFKTDPPTSFPSNRPFWIGGTNASICDEQGNLLAFSNGFTIFNKEENIMAYGDSLDLGDFQWQFYDSGSPIWYSGFFLPRPYNNQEYYFFYFSTSNVFGSNNRFSRLKYALIDFSKRSGLGEVIERDEIVSEGHFMPAATCKHGNGRDWWMIFPDNVTFSNKKNRILITPDSILVLNPQSIGAISTRVDPAGRKGFSSDGTKYAINGGYETIEVFDFDRCNGELSNHRTFELGDLDNKILGDFEFSPNGRFLYFNTNIEIMQLDLWVDTLNWGAVDTVAVYDGFRIWNVGTSFHQPQLGPDNKLYYNCTTTAPYLHVIHNPNEKGTACHVEQHAVRLAGRHRYSMPYFPNYRLGALEGSPCDTINPISTTEYLIEDREFNVFPNPINSAGKLTVNISNDNSSPYSLELHNLLGEIILRKESRDRDIYLSIPKKVSSGIYFLTLRSNNEVLGVKRVVVH